MSAAHRGSGRGMSAGQRAQLEAAAARDLGTLDRRGFLRLAGAAAGAGLLPLGCGAAPERLAPPPDLELVHLSPRTYAVLTAATARVAGPQGAALIDRGALRPGVIGERFLAESPDLAAPLGQALLVLEYGVWPLLGKLGPFTGQGPAGQDDLLRELSASRLSLKRLVFNGIRSVSLLCFYGSLAEDRPPGVTLGAIPRGTAVANAMAE